MLTTIAFDGWSLWPLAFAVPWFALVILGGLAMLYRHARTPPGERNNALGGAMTEPTDSSQPLPLRTCPVCSAPLIREDRVGVPVDVCGEHGIWLDRGELREIIQRDWVQSQSTYAELDQQVLERERRRARMKGTLWELFRD